MYARLIRYPRDRSFFLFGPRSTGKSTWVRAEFPSALYLDLLKASTYNRLLAEPDRLDEMIPPRFADWVVLDEVQRIPPLLDEVHRLIESRRLRFILTGSSARKLRRGGVNLLGGRAVTLRMFPFTAAELGADFNLGRALRQGTLPPTCAAKDPVEFLEGYVQTYLQEEIGQEGLTRNVGGFARFLEAASFSQGALLNVSTIARDCAVPRKTVEAYFQILDDLQLCYRLELFQKRSKRKRESHPKFYLFDAGVYRTIRPLGPLDSEAEASGPALETLVLQELVALNSYLLARNRVGYWRTAAGQEVDFVLYGPKGLFGIEVKKGGRVRTEETAGLRAFLKEYPQAKAVLVYGGRERGFDSGIEILPAAEFFSEARARFF